MKATPIEIIHLSKSYNHKVLNDISLSVDSGDIFGIIGVNGAGKTTLIKSALRLIQNYEGEIKFFGIPNDNIASRRKIAYLPEKFQPSPFLKGKEFIKITLARYKAAYNREIINQIALSLFFDPNDLEKKISSYSKGMGQKLGLITIFASQIAILILDEPMSGLDPIARAALKRLMKAHSAKGGTILMSSHILADIEEICTKMAVLDKATIKYCGDPIGFISKSKAHNLEDAFLEMTINEAI